MVIDLKYNYNDNYNDYDDNDINNSIYNNQAKQYIYFYTD